MNAFLKSAACCVAVGALGACSAGNADSGATAEPSALVQVKPAVQGDLPDVVTAYGVATAAADAVITLNVQAQGSLTRIDAIPGQAVKRGQRLLVFTLAAPSMATLRQARTALDVANAQRQHTAQLFAQQLATKDQLAQAVKAADDARSALDALPAASAPDGTINIVAPFDGVVTAFGATAGDTVQPGAALVSLGRSDRLSVIAGIEANAMNRVKAGNTVTMSPLDDGKDVSGAVRRVASSLDPKTHQAAAEIVPEGQPVAGMTYRAAITVGLWHGWLLPREAVIGEGADTHIFQTDKGKAVSVPVTVLGEHDDMTAVSGPVQPDRPVVTVGAAQLENDMQVRSGNAPAAR
ncbi:RND family efflux transporter MFP subunit [Luteibacter rhizovicinus]|uniref:RND family efflux transporter MFP subunit n=1 Tax=Luteibacter rhizovicinus TaxID=242606 RepID=A0A4R3YFU5_9GAMM|nr:efflux RND transporter periplasmic adaptor subunit [Luteibacter rhizovicinus]TCV91445.1 RND family efflux transporter MFP subunit [Luteibacter rhizovicinus]